jgi:hypothetical protein
MANGINTQGRKDKKINNAVDCCAGVDIIGRDIYLNVNINGEC